MQSNFANLLTPHHQTLRRILRNTGKPYMRGPDVRAVQRVVGSKVDGYYGPITAAAVRRFQRNNNLAPTGVVNQATWDAIAQAQSGNSYHSGGSPSSNGQRSPGSGSSANGSSNKHLFLYLGLAAAGVSGIALIAANKMKN